MLNAFDFQILRELARACEDASWDDEIRVVVLTGKGRAFCVGADLRSWADEYLGKPNEYWKWFGAFKDAHDRLREIGKPTLARINGICVGGGNELQMACDLAVMVDDAFIRHVGPEHGSVPAGGATQWLTLFVGERRAREIVLMCEPIPAETCAEWGSSTGRSRGGARREGRRGRREPRAEAAADDALREAAPELLEGPRVARDDQPRARLARALDGDRGAAGRGEAVPREEGLARQLDRNDVERERFAVAHDLDGDVCVDQLRRHHALKVVDRGHGGTSDRHDEILHSKPGAGGGPSSTSSTISTADSRPSRRATRGGSRRAPPATPRYARR